MEIVGRKRRVASAPAEWVVFDGLTRCPYIPGQVARLPMRLPERRLRPEEFSTRLSKGDRRQGMLLYRPRCPMCQACEAIRLDVHEFTFSKTHRRVLRRGDQQIETRMTLPTATEEKVDLYNEHKQGRGLWVGDEPIDLDGYQEFLVESCTDSVELQYRVAGELAGVAIVDRGSDALSAVYCCYDPAHSRLSIGTYSVLKQVELCHEWGLRYLYLGLYVSSCDAMAYKADYRPHERLIRGEWRRFS